MGNNSFGNQPPNILIVDDVSTNLVILSDMVKATGCIPRPVISVKQAQIAIGRMIPQLILLDVSMPEIDGFEFCAMLKNDVKTRDIPIIFISALDSVQDKIKGFELGGVDYIAKPFEKEEVTLRINTHLKIFKMQQELETYNKQLHKMVNEHIAKIQEEQKIVLGAMASLAEMKEDATGKHLEAIGVNCRLLSISLRFSPKFDKEITTAFIDDIELASQLHDVGKMGIRDQILLKPGPLNVEEREMMKTHCEIGARELEKIYDKSAKNEFMKIAIDIAKYHHEKWDGTGYPEGLAGEQIPLAARIMAIVDVYDALTSERCYKPAFSHEESMRIMEEESGIHFDPGIMAIFKKIQKQLRSN